MSASAPAPAAAAVAATTENVAAASTVTAAAAASSSPAASASAAASAPRTHAFSFAWMEGFVHAQIWFLDRSLLVWVGDSPHMHSMALAIQSSMDASPSVSCLLAHGHALGSGQGAEGSGEEEQTGVAMAGRIASIFGLPVFVSLNLSNSQEVLAGGGGGADMALFVERSVIKELKICQKLAMFEAPAKAK